ncbi:MAG: HD domain-containing protein [Gammaproteobacteria bacterium]
MQPYRQSDYDVTNTVQVSSPAAVTTAVFKTLAKAFPDEKFTHARQAYVDFEKLFTGKWPGFLGCDMVYHDIQHTLDMSLAVARILTGHDLTVPSDERLGARRAELGMIVALFHDAGFIRKDNEDTIYRHGAELTQSHVGRSAELLKSYLPTIGLADQAELASVIVHFTGYEIPLDEIRVDDPLDTRLGHLVATGDMIAQMADRCYLEKCRDRLFPEFVLGGVNLLDGDGPDEPDWTPEELLRRTPMFFDQVMRERLDGTFNSGYKYLEVLFNGKNPYLESIKQTMDYLQHIIDTGKWDLLRREPPVFSWQPDEDDAITVIQKLAAADLKKLAG